MEPRKCNHRWLRGASFHTRRGSGLREFINELPLNTCEASGCSLESWPRYGPVWSRMGPYISRTLIQDSRAMRPDPARNNDKRGAWLWMLALELWLLLWLLPTRRATLRQGEPSQARQANQGIDSQMELDIFVMSAPVRQPLTTGCGTGCIQFVNGPRSKPVRGGDAKTFTIRKIRPAMYKHGKVTSCKCLAAATTLM